VRFAGLDDAQVDLFFAFLIVVDISDGDAGLYRYVGF
jgi:hypothetical protein